MIPIDLTPLTSLDRAAYNANSVFYVGYSGGVDSTVLLHAMVACVGAERVKAIHVNHQICAESDQWQQHCEDQAKQLDVAFIHETVNVQAQASLELAARKARYHAFSKYVTRGNVLVLGHHQQDQAETVLFRMLRGAGLKGLGGMASISCRSQDLGGVIFRPILDESKRSLYSLAKQQGVAFVEDQSNATTQFDRNFLRNKILPLLSSRWPKAEAKIAQSAQLLQQAQGLLDDYVAHDFATLQWRQEFIGESICLVSLGRFLAPKRHLFLRAWLERVGEQAPSEALILQTRQFQAEMTDTHAQVNVGHWCFRQFKGRLYLLPLDALVVPSYEKVSHNHFRALGWQCIVDDLRPVTVELNRQGVRAKPLARRHSQTIKKLYQEYAVPPWLRTCMPLIYLDGELAAVGNIFTCVSTQQPHLTLGQIRWFFQ